MSWLPPPKESQDRESSLQKLRANINTSIHERTIWETLDRVDGFSWLLRGNYGSQGLAGTVRRKDPLILFPRRTARLG
jgi:hypothetical protein